MKLRLPIAILVAALAACDARTSSEPAQVNATLTPMFRLLDRVVDAPLDTAYAGTRRVVFDYLVDGQNQHMDYTEQVYADGLGKYLIVPLSVAAPAMTDSEREVWVLMQRARDSFSYLHRDFRIRDLALFQQNYSLSVIPGGALVAGRTCVSMDIRHNAPGFNRYRIEVDPSTGLVMRWSETTPDGVTVATVGFQSFTLNPDLSGVILHGSRFDVEPLVPVNTEAQMGFPVPLPRLLPQGYRLTAADRINQEPSPWARVTYGDGAEQVFYLYTDRPESPGIHGSPMYRGPGQGAANPNPMHGAPVVWVHQIGPWTAVVGEFGHRRCMAVGKVPESALLDMIQSAIE